MCESIVYVRTIFLLLLGGQRSIVSIGQLLRPMFQLVATAAPSSVASSTRNEIVRYEFDHTTSFDSALQQMDNLLLHARHQIGNTFTFKAANGKDLGYRCSLVPGLELLLRRTTTSGPL